MSTVSTACLMRIAFRTVIHLFTCKMIIKIKFIMLILSFYFKIIESDVATYYLKKKIKENQMLLTIAANLVEKKLIREGKSVWTLKRSSIFWEVDCQRNGEKFFKDNFRMNRCSFNKLCSLLKSIEKQSTNYRDAIPLEKRVAIALYALGSASDYRSIGDLFGVGKATVCNILVEFCNETWKCLAPIHLNNFPLKITTIAKNIADFKQMGYPQCMGAIDACHVEIHPKKHEASKYYNNEGWYSVVLLALVNAKYNFVYIHCGSPGTCSASDIFEKSSLEQELQECILLDELSWQYKTTKIPAHIVGDAAFQLSRHLFKPYSENESTTEQKKFNSKLLKCQAVVEIAFGYLKARFKRIAVGLDNNLRNVNALIFAACVLHNFLIAQEDSIDEDWMVKMRRDARPNPKGINTSSDRLEGELIRSALKAYFNDDDLEEEENEYVHFDQVIAMEFQ